MDIDPDHTEPHREHSHGDGAGLSRRGFLAAVGAAAGSTVVPVAGLQAAAAGGASLTGAQPLRAAMHVHGSWSEGPGSWATQFIQAESNGLDLMFMTDHDFRALANTYLTNLDRAGSVSSSSGAATQRAATATGGVWRVLVESSGTAPASTSLAVEPDKTAANRMRTSIAGHTLTHTFGASRLGPGATYEIVVTLSRQPATSTRRFGQLQLVYRFENRPGSGRGLESGGLVGVVAQPLPPNGTALELPLEADVASLWPDVLALDNVLYGLEFRVASPQRGVVADVKVQSLRFTRTQNDEAAVLANQATVISTYAPRHPGVGVYAGVEVSKLDPHLNAILMPQFMPDQERFTRKTLDSAYVALVGEVHRDGGLVSLNHPFGANVGPALGAELAADKRREVFRSLLPTNAFGVDILETGYTLRGQVGTEVHLDLWDTFSRRARFLTGNGANDDHTGQGWKQINNGFFTGIWAATTAEPDLEAALAGGRAYAAHLGFAPGCQIDMLVDGAVPMGKVSVSQKPSRNLVLYVAGVPTGGSVRIVQGVVDLTGEDPRTVVLATLPASAFAGSGTVSRAINTTSSCFVRAQVHNNTGRLVAFGQPVWLLRTAPPGGVPAGRRP